MTHRTVASFWRGYNALSLRSKEIDQVWSVRIGNHYRALATELPDGLYWFWIGPHGEYDQRI